MAEIWWISWLFCLPQYWRILETCVNYIPIVILEMNMSIEGTVEVESSGRSLTSVSCPCLILFHSFPFRSGHVRISTLLFFMSWRLSPTCLAQARFLACLLCTYGVSIFLLKPPIAFVAKSLCGMGAIYCPAGITSRETNWVVILNYCGLKKCSVGCVSPLEPQDLFVERERGLLNPFSCDLVCCQSGFFDS